MTSDSSSDSTSDVVTDQSASALGIMQCLNMLAEEASGLSLSETAMALKAAIWICRAEREGIEGSVSSGGPAAAFIH